MKNFLLLTVSANAKESYFLLFALEYYCKLGFLFVYCSFMLPKIRHLSRHGMLVWDKGLISSYIINHGSWWRYNFFFFFLPNIRNGSVIVDLTITSNSREDVLELLIANVKFGRIGSFMVDKGFSVTYNQRK